MYGSLFTPQDEKKEKEKVIETFYLAFLPILIIIFSSE